MNSSLNRKVAGILCILSFGLIILAVVLVSLILASAALAVALALAIAEGRNKESVAAEPSAPTHPATSTKGSICLILGLLALILIILALLLDWPILAFAGLALTVPGAILAIAGGQIRWTEKPVGAGRLAEWGAFCMIVAVPFAMALPST